MSSISSRRPYYLAYINKITLAEAIRRADRWKTPNLLSPRFADDTLYNIMIHNIFQQHVTVEWIVCQTVTLASILTTRLSVVWSAHRDISKYNYRKTPNKRPWAFATFIAIKRTFSPSRRFLRNENRTIFG